MTERLVVEVVRADEVKVGDRIMAGKGRAEVCQVVAIIRSHTVAGYPGTPYIELNGGHLGIHVREGVALLRVARMSESDPSPEQQALAEVNRLRVALERIDRSGAVGPLAHEIAKAALAGSPQQAEPGGATIEQVNDPSLCYKRVCDCEGLHKGDCGAYEPGSHRGKDAADSHMGT
jgi:hypothetical protein